MVWCGCQQGRQLYPPSTFTWFILDATDAQLASTSANKYFGQDNRCYCPDNPRGYFVGVLRAIVRSSVRDFAPDLLPTIPYFRSLVKSPENSLSLAPTPIALQSREEWHDADFDLPEGDHIRSLIVESDKEDEDDGGARAKAVAQAAWRKRRKMKDEEGVSTIKVARLPSATDFESAFALPSDLTQLSLAPLPLSHRSSKNSLEWDAYSTLGFADACSSNSASSISLPGTEESDCEENESELEGLVIPQGLFESCQSGKHLKKLLELKKKTQIADHRDDFETGLVIEDDDDFNPNRLVSAKQPQHPTTRSKSVPARAPPPARPASRLRAGSCQVTTPAYQEALATVPPTSTNSLLSPKPGSLRGQKSHSGLKLPTPPSQRKGLTRKASLSSLMETSTSQIAGSGIPSAVAKPTRYDAPTAASRSTSRLHALDFMVPPTRPSTPSSNPAALRLTMPTSLRVKSRPSLASVFPGSSPNPSSQPTHRATSPIPPRPPSTLPPIAPSIAPKLLRRPKRQRTYGDGTELDGFDDLPTDREKECKFRAPTMWSPSLVRKRMLPSPVLGHTRRKPTLIRHLGAPGGPKVVCGMKWNPSTLRWEGNDQVLRDFDAVVGTSTRPALITHLTGSSIGSPVGSFASGARKVGNMIFDPVRMCWISTLPPDEEEPDVFADLADDEDEDAWETKGGTIRASQQSSTTPATQDMSGPRSSIIVTAPSPAHSRTRTTSESESDRGSRASIVYDVADDFVEVCRSAEDRHRSEMRGWRSQASRRTDPFAEPNRSFLYEIRALATRKY
ncbi:hypothetical protein EDD16DRAFT_1750304 [Pisolithus croceorrhizus]|nr:hypothetical protein EDD16DRAFT_1750304 [Pisolithus croceorrhizus]